MRKIYDMDLKVILPLSISGDKEVRLTADAISENLNCTSGKIESALIYSRIDNAADDVLDALAWQFHMDIYGSGFAHNVKSSLVKGSVKYHRYKGTVFALEEAVKAVSDNSKVQEWFTYSGEPFHFKIRTSTPFKDANHVKRLYKAIQDAKNVRSWLDEIDVSIPVNNTIFMGVRRKDRRIIHVYQADLERESLNDSLYIGGAMGIEETIEFRG